jgi:hypothetical protein
MAPPLVLILSRGNKAFTPQMALGTVPLSALLALDIMPVRLADHSRTAVYVDGLCALAQRVDVVLCGRSWSEQEGGLAAAQAAEQAGKPVLHSIEALRGWLAERDRRARIAAQAAMSAGAGQEPARPYRPSFPAVLP